MDDISLLYSSTEWKLPKKREPFDKYNVKKKKAAKIPQNEEVDRIEVRKQNEVARLALEDVKKKHRDKMTKLKARKDNLKQEQEDLVTNLGKFNTFVKEKQLKVERGISTEKAEKETRERMDIEIEQKEELLLELNQAKEFLDTSVAKRKQFHDFLQTVVDSEASRGRHKDIGELMKRCETLVATRDNLTTTRDKIRSTIQEEEESLAVFKEEQNARILDLSAKQNELQERYYAAEAKRMEKQRLIDTEAKEDINKQLLIANIKLSIQTLWQYVFSRKIVLPGDRKTHDEHSKEKPPVLDQQLASVQAHIEDLEVVIERVSKADNIEGYMNPLVSEFSELRLDY